MWASAALKAAVSAEVPPAISLAPANAVLAAEVTVEAAMVAAPIAAPAPKLPMPEVCPPELMIPASIGGSLLTKVSNTTDATSSTHRLFKSGVPTEKAW